MADRFEINHEGKIVVGESALCADQSRMLVNLFSQYGWTCSEVDKQGACHVLQLTSPSAESVTINVFSGSIRNEARNAYEKKIQLGTSKDPRKCSKKNTIILGIYVYEANDSVKDAVFVGYPIDEKINYDTNPSIRGTFVNKLLLQAKTKGFVYDKEHNSVGFRSEFAFFYLDNYYDIHYNNDNVPKMGDSSSDAGETENEDKGANIILYGVPGSGKSHEIKTEYCDDQAFMERAVFHPDYTYSDFVGQILPKIIVDEHGKKTVSYDFSAGPFTEILKKAVNDKEKKKYYLVVEEINRGNAPAIFGDIFQLLDRDDNGESEYGISNEAIAEYVYGNKDEMVKIPSNLYILATMNTSDQNVFTLDTAFKRRWEMKRIKNNIDECDFAEHKICGTGITWKSFVNVINELIIEVSVENLSNEDNRLGAFFVKESELDDSSKFGEKVLMYLWNDAFRYDHEKIFKSEYHTLDELIDGFEDEGFDIFVDSDRFDYQLDLDIGGKSVSIETYLEGKKDYLVKYYGVLRDYVKERIPDLQEASTQSLQYAAWRSDSISKASFADLIFRKDKLIISTEIPRKEELKGIGEIKPKDNHHNHYYEIIYDEMKLSEIVEVIVDSFEQLKTGEG